MISCSTLCPNPHLRVARDRRNWNLLASRTPPRELTAAARPGARWGCPVLTQRDFFMRAPGIDEGHGLGRLLTLWRIVVCLLAADAPTGEFLPCAGIAVHADGVGSDICHRWLAWLYRTDPHRIRCLPPHLVEWGHETSPTSFPCARDSIAHRGRKFAGLYGRVLLHRHAEHRRGSRYLATLQSPMAGTVL
jgi:hypothetical protein